MKKHDSQDGIILHLEQLEALLEVDENGESVFSDAEVKEIIAALVDYFETGKESFFSDRAVRNMFRAFANRIDYDCNKYFEVCEINRQNGKKGGAPKGNKNAFKNNRTVEKTTETTKNNRTVKKQPKQPNINTNTNINSNINSSTSTNTNSGTKTDTKSKADMFSVSDSLGGTGGKGANAPAPTKETPHRETTMQLFNRLYPDRNISEPMREKLQEWIRYKAERRETYKEQGMKSLLRRIENQVNTYGDIAVMNLIDECMANGWKGIIWDRLENKRAKKNTVAERINEVDKWV